MAEVFICPKGALADRDVRALQKAGVVVVQTDTPERCQFVRSGEIVSPLDTLWAALDALNASEYNASDKQRNAFAKNMLAIVAGARQKDATIPPKEGDQ